MCRVSIPANFTFPLDQKFRDRLERDFGYEFLVRERQVASALSKEQGVLIFQLAIGNEHSIIKLDPMTVKVGYNNCHKWTTYVRLSEKCLFNGIDISRLIKKVKFGLHPLFGFEVVEVDTIRGMKDYHFTLTREGHDVFPIKITIEWKKESGIFPKKHMIDYTLNFDGEGGHKI